MTICNRTPTSTEEARQFIAERMPYFTGQIEVLPGLPEKITPPKRSDWIDPESIPLRKSELPKSPQAISDKLTKQQAIRRRGKQLLREEWPEIDALDLARKCGVNINTIFYRIGCGKTASQATRGYLK